MTLRGAKILYGVCGIGLGHTFRQLPIIEHFSRNGTVLIFAYGESYRYYSEHFRDNRAVSIEPVAVPFFAGNRDGLDFEATAVRHGASPVDYLSVNCQAMDRAQRLLGKPDLVISDYEPVCAQYAYAHGSPLVTIDQQSKYLIAELPGELSGTSCADEVSRLRMFFPRAEARFACSFFDISGCAQKGEQVELCPPILKASILQMKREPSESSILVYVSSQRDFPQAPGEINEVLSAFPDMEFQVFVPDVADYVEASSANVSYYKHGDPRFAGCLKRCSGIVSTAGHSLLSEAMHLGLPVYAIPLQVYEQQMNAFVISENGFGISHPRFSTRELGRFVKSAPEYSRAIREDQRVLLRGSGQAQVVARLEAMVE